jgi:HD-like signal output (HDOD) protein
MTDLRPLPESAVRILELTGDPRTSVEQLTDVIDPTVASKLLRLANSGYYGQRGEVATVRDAVVLLGFEAVRVAAVGTGVIASGAGLGPYDARRFWAYGLALGELSALVASAHRRVSSDAFTAGLLHGLGRMVLAQHSGGQLLVNAVALAQERHVELSEAQIELLGTDEAALGGALAARWSLPRTLVAAVGGHGVRPEVQHDPESVAADTERACAFARACGLTDGIEPPRPHSPADIDPEWLSGPMWQVLKGVGGLATIRDRANAFVNVALGSDRLAA